MNTKEATLSFSIVLSVFGVLNSWAASDNLNSALKGYVVLITTATLAFWLGARRARAPHSLVSTIIAAVGCYSSGEFVLRSLSHSNAIMAVVGAVSMTAMSACFLGWSGSGVFGRNVRS
jgi:hypothetical protein